MKYNTIGAVNAEKKASFTIYADMDISRHKVATNEAEISSLRTELERVQKALKQETRRCRELVTEYTRALQKKERQYQSERFLRDDQLSKILRALLIYESRLKKEQKILQQQLKEKDTIITKQSNEIKKLLSSQYCKSCNQYYSPSSNLESLESSSEYVVTDYQSSNLESLDSSSDIYATISEKSYENEGKNLYLKNKGRKGKKVQHKKSVGSYFEVLKLRSDEDNTSNDYDNLESLPPESLTDKSQESNEAKEENDSSASECNNTVIKIDETKSKITETIPVFEGGETNDNWYASASDQEDDEQRDIYRNNPVLECMNQILLQNINDSMSSPPKTPNPERKMKTKKVKFSDEEVVSNLTKENVTNKEENHGYYETPIQKVPNFYETPQSIYSNDYEQILSKCGESFEKKKGVLKSPEHYYVDLDQKNEKEERKTKILRTPPALPPKPANLVMKYKINKVKENEILESEPDYCSISELNLPTNKNVSFKKINVVAEINSPSSQDVISKLEKAKKKDSDYDPVGTEPVPNLVVKKCVEKLNIQLAKQTPIKSESPKKTEEIPKLPQVSEIIIPEEEEKQQEERISHDNYVKNNSQILKSKKFEPRRSIVMGTSVSSLISGFNNQLISEISKKPEKKAFSSFENLQNLDKPKEFDKFDLSQNFEEFKLDDCEIEEYSVNDIPDISEEEAKSEASTVDSTPNSTRVELIRATNDNTVPSLNVNSVELLKRQLELQKSKITKENQTKKSEPTYEHFLECTGLSSKSILTPSRLLSNHKSMLKPKDIKLRSKVNKSNLIDRHSTSVIKYWSEPYL